jgi:hypothetical protein
MRLTDLLDDNKTASNKDRVKDDTPNNDGWQWKQWEWNYEITKPVGHHWWRWDSVSKQKEIQA